jgi:hypothetical protein
MENQLNMLATYGGATTHQASEPIDWLQPSYDPATANVAQHVPLSAQSPPPLAASAQQAHHAVLHSLHAHTTPFHADGFGWTEFSPRSVNVPDTAPATTGTTDGAHPAGLKPNKQQQQASQAQARVFLAPSPPHLPFSGVDFVHPAFLMPPCAPGPPPVDGAAIADLPPAVSNAQRPPLPAKAKRGRDAPKRAPKPGTATGAALANTVRAAAARAAAASTNGGDVNGAGPARAAAVVKPPGAISTEEKKRVRAERNRESAEKSRLRRKKYTEDLEKEVGTLRDTNRTLKTRAEGLLAMLQSVDGEVEDVIARGDGFAADAPNGGAALKAALLALENVRQQCPMTFADTTVREDIGHPSAGKRK